jgi:hypothetical protein
MTVEITKKQQEVAVALDDAVYQVIGADAILGFRKAFQVANATKQLKELLNDEYLEPIMLLQGNRLGFKTDKDTSGGYDKRIVKNCLIEAVLTGVQPYMNQFNIIAGNMYVTKEGFGYLLSNIKGLKYEIIPMIPKVEGTQATIVMRITWSVGASETEVREIEFVIKVNSYMGADAIIGKATRKSRAWLYNQVTGVEVGDGDVAEVETPKNTIVLQNQGDNTFGTPKSEEIANNTNTVVAEAKAKKEKIAALATKGKSENIVEETYQQKLTRMSPQEIVEEFNSKMPFTKEAFSSMTGQKIDKKVAVALLLALHSGTLGTDLDRIYGVTLADVIAEAVTKVEETTTDSESEPTQSENDGFTKIALMDEFVENGIDLHLAIKELGYASEEDMLSYATLKQVGDYVKTKKG